jgi:hypothetical protein
MPVGPSDPRFEVTNPEIQKLLQALASKLHSLMPPGYGFTFLLFEFGGPGAPLFYVSDANRGDMIRTMQECIGKMREHHDPPVGTV